MPASAGFCAGQTIRIVIPFSAGGGTDSFGRLIAAHLGNHIPGNPTFIAENVTGAGGLLGSNGFARAGIDSPAGLMHMQGRITKGITDPVGPIESIVAPEMFGIDHRPVPGFGGRGDTRLAFERGELLVNPQSTPAFNARVVPLVEEGTAMVACAIGFIDPEGNPVRDPAAPDIITAPEPYMEVHGQMPSGEAGKACKVVANLVQTNRGTIRAFEDAPKRRLRHCAPGSTRW